ncbi:Holliday junction branch migration protein RuvA [Lentisphaerota bacterium WC36G]|nr:Holliday junction branch migration protein RuvA [Lentisphaerae bacterium WC36]
MIGQLTGILVETNFTEVILDVNGVGYSLLIPMSTFDRLPEINEKVTLKTHLHVREDALTLFGFSTPEEMQLFKILITVNGIGPKMALNILSTMPVSSFCSAILNSEIAVINKISGVGKKTAERLIIELKDKLSKLSAEVETNSITSDIPAEYGQNIEDAILALEQLGFKRETVKKALKKLIKTLGEDELSTANLVRLSLKLLNS